MTDRDAEIRAERLTAVRVFIHRGGSDDVVVRTTGSVAGDRHYLISRNEFLRLVRSLGHDAAKLSLMSTNQEGAIPS